jgi:hypothetical protein
MLLMNFPYGKWNTDSIFTWPEEDAKAHISFWRRFNEELSANDELGHGKRYLGRAHSDRRGRAMVCRRGQGAWLERRLEKHRSEYSEAVFVGSSGTHRDPGGHGARGDLFREPTRVVHQRRHLSCGRRQSCVVRVGKDSGLQDGKRSRHR